MRVVSRPWARSLCVSTFVFLFGCVASTAPLRVPPGGAAQGRAAPASSCGLDDASLAAAVPTVMPGTRVRVPLPHPNELVWLNGLASVAHPCGFGVVAFATPPIAEWSAFLRGAVRGFLESTTASGWRCKGAPDGDEWACERGDLAMYARRFVAEQGGALVSVTGPRADRSALREIGRGASYDPSETFNPLTQMHVSLLPPEGMTMSAGSTGALLDYDETGVDDSFGSVHVHWRFQPYALHAAHADNSSWTAHELGEVTGTLARTQVSWIREDSFHLRESADDGSMFAGTFDADLGPVPTLLYVRAVRDRLGVFTCVARIPQSRAQVWLPRIEAHARSLQIGR